MESELKLKSESMHLPSVCSTIRVNNQSVQKRKNQKRQKERTNGGRESKESQRNVKENKDIDSYMVHRGPGTWQQMKSRESKAQ